MMESYDVVTMQYLLVYKYSMIHGGIPVIMRHLGKGLLQADARNEISILAEHPDYSQVRRCREEGFDIYFWNLRNIFFLLFRRQIDVVCIFEPYTQYILLVFLWKLLRPGTKAFLVFCGTKVESPSGLVKRLGGLTRRFFHGCIAVSTYAQRTAFRGKYVDHIRVVYNPVDAARYRQTDFSRYAIITIGRICDRKNYLDLLRMFAIVHQANRRVHLDIIGGHEDNAEAYYRQVRKLAQSLSLDGSITFHGDVAETEKVRLLATSRLYVTTSLHEMFGITTVEALASGLPVIAFDNTATSEVVSAAGGILVSDGDTAVMAKTVLQLIDNKQQLRELSSRSLAAAQLYGLPHFLRGYEAAFTT